ncbi:condensation domain-containing protein, partial [Mycetocola reblochoni]
MTPSPSTRNPAVRIPAVLPAEPAPLPLTGSQRGIVAACLVDPSSTDFVVGDVLHLAGLPAGAPGQEPHGELRSAILGVLAETPWLGFRVSGAGEGDAARLVPGNGVTLEVHDVRGDNDALALALAAARTDASTPLAPDADCLARLRLWLLSDDEAAVSLVVHHVLLDGYGVHAVLRRFLSAYRYLRGEGELPRPWTDPAEVVALEAAYASSTRAEEDRRHWATARPAAEAVHSFRLPRDPSAPPAHAEPLVLHLGAGPEELAERTGTTFVDVLAAAHAIALSRWSGASRVVLGVPLMNRTGAAAGAPSCTVNVLPLALTVDRGADARALLAEVAAARRLLRRHGRYRAEELMTLHGHLAEGTTATGTELNVKLFEAPPRVEG